MERGTFTELRDLSDIQEIAVTSIGATAVIEQPESAEETTPPTVQFAGHEMPPVYENRSSKWRNGRIGRWATRLAIVGALLGGAVATEATPAYASTDVRIQDTDGEGVWLHDGPGLHSTLKLVMPEGAKFTADCYNKSDPVGGNPVWLHGVYHSPDGDIPGDVTDAFTSTEWQSYSDLEAQGIPGCNTKQEEPKNQTADPNNLQPAGEVKPFTSFNRSVAANWAKDHAMDAPKPAGIDACTIFVSKMLEAGGMPEDDRWNMNFVGMNRNGARYGTDAAWIAPELAMYLNSVPYVDVIPLGHMNAGNNNIPKARPGDIIAYRWHGDGLDTGIESLGSVEHLSVVVGHADGNPEYPTVAEWGNTKPTPYTSRGWTYSVKSNGWLQKEDGQHNMFAYLIHIRTEDDL